MGLMRRLFVIAHVWPRLSMQSQLSSYREAPSPVFAAALKGSDALVGGSDVSGASVSADPQPSRIPAYAKLEFSEGFDFFIQTLSVTIGRRPPSVAKDDSKSAADPVKLEDFTSLGISPILRPVSAEREHSAPPDAPSSSSVSAAPPASVPSHPSPHPQKPVANAPTPSVDVDLGPIKAVSRCHARLSYDYRAPGWVLDVQGRNGAVVDGSWRAKGEHVLLQHRSRIQIAERIFHFVLPNQAQQPQPNASVNTIDTRTLHPEQANSEHEDSLSDKGVDDNDHHDAYDSSAMPEDDPALGKRPVRRKKDSTKAAASKSKTQVSAPSENGKRATGTKKKGVAATDAAASTPAKPSKVKKKNNALESKDPEPEAPASSKKAKATKAPKTSKPSKSMSKTQQSSVETESAKSPPVKAESAASKRKSKPKPTTENASINENERPPEATASPIPSAQKATAAPAPEHPTNPHQGKPGKPPFTYASLIAQALVDSPTKRFNVDQIYDWIKEKYPFYQDESNTSWQNSIRHNLSLNRAFVKTPYEGPDPTGSLAQWSMDPDLMHLFDGLNFKKPKPVVVNTGKGLTANINGNKSGEEKPANPASGPTKQSEVASKEEQNQHVPIVIAPIPDSYVRPAAPPSADDRTAALLKDPPIILHEGKLILSPTIFAHLTKEQLQNLQALGLNQAMQILQAYIVQYFKDQLKGKTNNSGAADETPPSKGPAQGNVVSSAEATWNPVSEANSSLKQPLSLTSLGNAPLPALSQAPLPSLTPTSRPPAETPEEASNKRKQEDTSEEQESSPSKEARVE